MRIICSMGCFRMTQNREYVLNESEEIKSHDLMMRTRDSESQDIFTIYVEGPSDEVFYRRWLKKSGLDKKFSILVFDVEKAKNISLEGSGNCGRIIKGAEKYSYDDRKLFIADRDLREDSEVQEFTWLKTLFFTEFPAIESYSLVESVLKELNYRRFDGDSKCIEDYYHYIGKIVRFLYLARREFSEKMEIYGRFRGILLRAIESEINQEYSPAEGYKRILEVIRENASEDIRNSDILDNSFSPPDIRKHAYGHDIAPVLRNFIRTQISDFNQSDKYIELALTNIYIDLGLYGEDKLFKEIQEYMERKICNTVGIR